LSAFFSSSLFFSCHHHPSGSRDIDLDVFFPLSAAGDAEALGESIIVVE